MDIAIKRDGLTLRGKLDKPVEGNCPIAIFFHGFAVDIGYTPDSPYKKIADALLKAGIAVIRFDFNGHGKSDGEFSNMNILNEIEDAIAIIEYVRTFDWATQIYLVGHSQGGVIAGMMAGYYPDIVSKAVLVSPAASLKLDAQKGRCMTAHYDTNHIPVKVNIDGVHEVGGHYFRIAKSLPIFEITSLFEKDTMVIIGANDEVVSIDEAKKYSETMKHCKFELVPNLDHGLAGPTQGELIEKIVNFLK